MGAPREHWLRAEANRALAGELRSKEEFNWAVTVSFYAAVHYATALLAKAGVATDTLTHIDREYQLDQRYPGVLSRYLSLKGQSIRARYIAGHEENPESCRRAAERLDFIIDFCRRYGAAS